MVSTGNTELDSLIQEETDNSLTFDEVFLYNSLVLGSI